MSLANVGEHYKAFVYFTGTPQDDRKRAKEEESAGLSGGLNGANSAVARIFRELDPKAQPGKAVIRDV
ncbi:hypothetical protein A2311_01485 [candidate division WOR-1 bacterium RIFOXYB2_FULL_48_7]|uniref:Uncharacterized protein n=1 Tax=candidate division WOR-1 bacterium RIFOXYB2_FULL_48_7 TaxID=1802583 RepID=A0A1F4TTD5_UNCSA|nr:MAG: hypothetical protein A2311_01485 [candidate division WOR-1 bacterium RIFOXYB2_FULL_48_7]